MMSNKEELINSLKMGDIVLIDYTKQINEMESEDEDEEDFEEENEEVKNESVVLEVTKDEITFSDDSESFPFKFSKEYLLNSNIELEVVLKVD